MDNGTNECRLVDNTWELQVINLNQNTKYLDILNSTFSSSQSFPLAHAGLPLLAPALKSSLMMKNRKTFALPYVIVQFLTIIW